MARLDIERQRELQPKRMQETLDKLQDEDFEVVKVNECQLDITTKHGTVQFFPYSGWHSGKGIKSGRGFKELLIKLNQIK